MTRSRSRRRGSLTGFLGDIVDDTKEFVDDMLDRGDDDDDLDRHRSPRRTVRYRDEERDLEGLREELGQLRRQLERLIDVQQSAGQKQNSE